MSLFDEDSPMNPVPWLQEKSLKALEDSARLVDLANEPDTTSWYERKLKEHSSRIIGRLAPIVALLHEAGQEAANHEAWSPIVEGGSFALAGWCKRYDIRDPVKAAFDLVAQEQDEQERDEKAETPEEETIDAEDTRSAWIRLQVYSRMAQRMLHEDVPDNARRLLLWLLHDLYLSPWADAVSVSRKFLPGDIGCTPDQTLQAYRFLCERGFVERSVELSEADSDRLVLRLIADGVNEHKHPTPYQDERFGYPGARIAGKPTWGNHVLLSVPEAYRRVLHSWRLSDDDLALLRDALQRIVGEDRVFVEEVKIAQIESDTCISARVRTPFDTSPADDDALKHDLETAAETWLRERTAVKN
jgi:hypothetical protein